jgi:hypothetical protein
MVQNATSWIKEHSALATFLGAQLVGALFGAAWMIAYTVKLETRVHILETRGAAYSVQRMDKMANEIAVLEQKIGSNETSIKRLVDQYLKDRQQTQPR